MDSYLDVPADGEARSGGNEITPPTNGGGEREYAGIKMSRVVDEVFLGEGRRQETNRTRMSEALATGGQL